jgi:glycosyltransferase involved in cell wall biosynthesis
MNQKNPRICLISFIFHDAFIPPITNLERVLLGITNNVYTLYAVLNGVIKKNELPGQTIIHKRSKTILFRIFYYILLQLKLSVKLIRIADNIDCFILFMESGSLLIIITAKLMRKKIYWMLPSSFEKMLKLNNDPISLMLIPLQKISLALSDNIIIYSPNLIVEWNLQKYQQKILIAHEHVINTEIFTITTPLFTRPPLIGYIGRLSEEKGILNFVQALPAISSDNQDLRVLIGGDGPLKERVITTLQVDNLIHHVDLPGWISRDDLPLYLNRIRLLVIPSYTEGLPNIMLEAMACGTPIMAMPVGAIPDIIIDSETGFIMEENSPECIASNVNRALVCRDIGKIAENGRHIVLENFTLKRSIDCWGKILADI